MHFFNSYIDFIKGDYIPLVKVKDVPIYLESPNYDLDTALSYTTAELDINSLVKEFEDRFSKDKNFKMILKELNKKEKPYIDKNGIVHWITETTETFSNNNYTVYIIGKRCNHHYIIGKRCNQ